MRKLLIVLLACLGFTAAPAQENHNFETAKALDIFNALYRDLDLHYVDTLNAEKTVGDAIRYMLNRLDPYTEFYKEEETDELRTLTTGKYAGIGSPIRFHKGEDRCVFDGPYDQMPAAKAGVRTGDVIMRINGQDIPPCGNQEIQKYSNSITTQLRGEPGTSFTLTVKRPGTNKLLTLKLTRQTIKRPSVLYASVLPNGVGYVLLNGYTEDTATDLKAALENLKAKGAKQLVFDLRSNGGGLMDEAVKVINFFIPKGKLVLQTKGKIPELNRSLKTTADPFDTHIPMAVLVDYGTASAAEITSGSLQDYDRAVIVGRRTYGKGLVQAPRPLPYKTVLKVTTSKYFIPSGRCVQAYDFKNRGADGQPLHLPDSLSKTFKTAAGRPVKDGGGITPDVAVELDSLPNLINYLDASEELFDYCVTYCNTHAKIAPAKDFRLTDAEFEDFKRFMGASKFSYDNQTKRALDRVRQWAAFEGYAEGAKAELDALEAKLSHSLTDDLELWKKEVRRIVESTIVANIYGQEGFVEYSLREDRDLNTALDVLHDEARYKAILKK